MLQSINLQKSLEKIVLLQNIEDKICNNDSLLGIAFKMAIVENSQSIFKTVKDCTEDNRQMMIDLLGEPLLNKILSHS